MKMISNIDYNKNKEKKYDKMFSMTTIGKTINKLTGFSSNKNKRKQIDFIVDFVSIGISF